MIGAYQPSLTGPRGPACFSGNITQGQGKCSLESDSRWYYMAIFVLSQLLMGAGIAPFYSLVPAYLDENVTPKQMPLYLGAWTFATFLGPGLGMIIGGKFLSIYVDLEQVRYISLMSRKIFSISHNRRLKPCIHASQFIRDSYCRWSLMHRMLCLSKELPH